MKKVKSIKKLIFDPKKLYFKEDNFGLFKLQKTGKEDNTYMFLDVDSCTMFFNKKGTLKELIEYTDELIKKDSIEFPKETDEYFYYIHEFKNFNSFIKWYLNRYKEE